MDEADDLLQRALIDAADSAAVALRVDGLSTVSETMTVIFHGRRDLGTIQTYVANGGRGAGARPVRLGPGRHGDGPGLDLSPDGFPQLRRRRARDLIDDC